MPSPVRGRVTDLSTDHSRAAGSAIRRNESDGIEPNHRLMFNTT